jgi:D-sedoheptulose 7-phosphate isomerase
MMVDEETGYTTRYLAETAKIAAQIDAMIGVLLKTRERGGRVSFLGVGGGGGHAGHAVNDFRKLPALSATHRRTM